MNVGMKLLIIFCALSLLAPAVVNAHGTPVAGHTEPR